MPADVKRPVKDPGITAIRGKGIYILHLELESECQRVVGKLGTIRFAAGHYAYVGRAFGSGGLAARLSHHLRLAASPHWHIDFLQPHLCVREIWYGRTPPSDEHRWAWALSQIRGATLPAEGFGSSDCRCQSHLVRFARAPGKATFRRHLRRLSVKSPPPIRRIVILRSQAPSFIDDLLGQHLNHRWL